MSKRFEVGTDGACRGNPGPGSWAVVGEDGSGSAGARPATTNNIMELTAIREALLDYADMPLRVKSDSTYAVKSALGQWSARLTGSTKNGALIAEVREALAAHPDAELVWVRGHDATNSQPLNTAADALCNESLDRLGVSETYEEYEVGDIVIDWEGKPLGPSGKKTSVAKTTKRFGKKPPWLYAILRRAGYAEAGSTRPTQKALDESVAFDTGKSYDSGPYFLWDEGLLLALIAESE